MINKLLEPILNLLAKNKANKWFLVAILGAYVVTLVFLVFAPDFGVKGTGVKDMLISGFDIASSAGAFLLGSKLGK